MSARAIRSNDVLLQPPRMRVPTLALASLLTIAAAAGPLAAQDGRATRLAAATTLDGSQLAERQAAFLAWLDSAGPRMAPPQAQGALEYAYYLIGSVAQAQHRRTGRLFPARDTMGLATLFDRAHALGAPGAALVAGALRAAGDAPAPILPGGTLWLSFAAPDYTLGSSRGWSIRFPYFMMIGAAQTGVPGNGVKTETVVLSTLFANDSSPAGRSQATVMLNAAAAADSAAFVPFWLQALGLDAADRDAGASGAGAETYREYDPRERMHKEVVVTRRGGVVFVVAYAGLPGTFQANRAEFRALLETLVEAPPGH